MENILIVSHTEKGVALLTELLSAASYRKIAAVASCSEARRLLLERDFDLVIINSPLRDESGEALARHIAAKGDCQVMLVVKSEFLDAVSAVCEGDGVLTIQKPISRALFWSALSFSRSAQNRLKRIQAENTELKQKIEDIRIIDRAKCILISHMNMDEQEAHRYIEKQAMDLRTNKRSIAEGILRTYEN